MTAETQNPAQTPDPNGDSFARLHRMSRTAGAGTTDYVAVNNMAVAALIVGLMGWLAVMDDALLLVPLLGIVLGVMGVTQIIRSNGTQTGLWLAILGMVLSVGFAGYVGAAALAEKAAFKRDGQVIEQVRATLASSLAAGDHATAFAQFSPIFQQRMTLEEFSTFWKGIDELQYGGKIVSITWNGRMEAEKAPGSLTRYAKVVWAFKAERQAEPFTREVVLMQIGDGWKVHDVQNLFPPPTTDATKANPGA
jgi:hypothetical protein